MPAPSRRNRRGWFGRCDSWAGDASWSGGGRGGSHDLVILGDQKKSQRPGSQDSCGTDNQLDLDLDLDLPLSRSPASRSPAYPSQPPSDS
ncbi:unnamed protein product [Diplocarpon coronariae]|nr:hypothetical protein JHW43_008740 [Diplocarpon mali]